MDYFSRGFKSVLGGPEEGQEGPSGAETIDRLCDRVSSATLLEDRRDAVRAIKSLSKKFRLEVGTTGMTILLSVLEKDRNDAEICGLALEALVNIMTTSEETTGPTQDDELALQFAEIFLKNTENIPTLLALLEEYDFRVRWPTVRLLSLLLESRALQIQQIVLVSPLGVSRLMDLLSDTREVIRNDGLLLLIQLTKGNAAIQKIVAFENAFDKLMEVITEEGYSDGGIVVEDCLQLMTNLFNPSNINFFREGSYIQRMVPFFDFSEYSSAGRQWTEEKVKNVLLMLKLVRLLVSPNNPPQSTLSSQKILHSCNLLKILCDILMTIGIPAEILTETVNTVGGIIRGNQTNQAFFSVVDAPYNPPKPAIVVLLMSMISDKQPFTLRCAVLYCFQCYLYKNTQGQQRIISTLLPSSAEASNVTAGQLLCGGLFSPDPFSNWCAAIALSHALLGNKELKEQLLRVQLATGVSNQPVSLLQQCCNILSNGGSTVQTRAAVLSLLCSWTSNCPVAVSHLLSNGAIIPYLIACVEQPCDTHEAVIQGLSAILIGVCIVYNGNDVEAFSVDAIKRLITTRLDPEHFLAKINDVSKTEPFTNAAKHTQISETKVEDVLFDHEFTRQFKKLEVNISKVILEDEDDEDGSNSKESNSALIVQYKTMIREQDDRLRAANTSYKQLHDSFQISQHDLERQAIELVQLRNQVGIMKEQSPVNTPTDQLERFQAQVASLQEQLKERDQTIQDLQAKELSSTNLNGEVHSESGYNSQDLESPSSVESETLLLQVESLKEQNINLTQELEKTKASLTVTQASLEVITTNKMEDSETNRLSQEEIEELQSLRLKVTSLQTENTRLKEQVRTPEKNLERISQLEQEVELKNIEQTQQRQDYEDLLVLLEDQDSKIKKFKTRLRELGEVVPSDSADDDSAEED
ncbi:general vesicular transport factor p115-like [Clytia hemisphaerica]|uniref:Vesicle tethering protein Uso1/P115-like head domain-containing protein n=1 Tax=Clytia hemisphaerica TaxID=252671 RepID=A0A7M5VF99_9CNID